MQDPIYQIGGRFIYRYDTAETELTKEQVLQRLSYWFPQYKDIIKRLLESTYPKFRLVEATPGHIKFETKTPEDIPVDVVILKDKINIYVGDFKTFFCSIHNVTSYDKFLALLKDFVDLYKESKLYLRLWSLDYYNNKWIGYAYYVASEGRYRVEFVIPGEIKIELFEPRRPEEHFEKTIPASSLLDLVKVERELWEKKYYKERVEKIKEEKKRKTRKIIITWDVKTKSWVQKVIEE